MSCYCEKYNLPGEGPVCPCDQLVHPPPLRIPAGLAQIPRQTALFPEFRQAMLTALRQQGALAGWQARGKDDLGMLLLEMWAYVCDNLSFYDEVIAQEAYLRTSRQRSSLRRLVALLGYQPRPAVAATVSLAAFATGRKPVMLPVGTAFRSSAFGGEAPQLFEVLQETLIHPLTNRWNITAPHPGIITQDNPATLLIDPQTEIREGSLFFIQDTADSSQNQPALVLQVESYPGADGQVYTRLTFTTHLRLSAGTRLTDLKLLSPTQTAKFWTIGPSPQSITTSGGTSLLVLDKLYPQMKPHDYILISRAAQSRWFRLTQVSEVLQSPNPNSTITINNNTFALAPIKVAVSQLRLDTGINAASRKGADTDTWDNNRLPELVIHYDLRSAGKIVDEAKTTILATDDLFFSGPIEKPLDDFSPTVFLLQDKNFLGLQVQGQVGFTTRELQLNQGQETNWQHPLTIPVEVYGNVITATRGESVQGEILGSGNASLPNQSFQLKKKPLTYLASPTAGNDQGVAGTLQVYVNGVRWTEVSSFFGLAPDQPVYIVRQDDAGESVVTFGDGNRGQRVPTGTDNILAYYRFGAGAASPPAGAVSQIDKPREGLQSVKNPLPAAGGADAEVSEQMRSYAPRSILTLGRAVSMPDMEAMTLSVPGVRVVQAEWRWDGGKQRPVVKIWYIGETGIEATVTQRLRSVTDPATPIKVIAALAVAVHLSLDISIDPRFLATDVVTEIRQRLTGAPSGFLLPESQLIGRPLFQSKIFETILQVPGTLAVRSISWNGSPFGHFAKSPGAGHYFDFEQGTLAINGKTQ